MQKLTYLLAIVMVLSSCGTVDDQPLTEAPLIAGEPDQAGVAYTNLGINYLFSDVQSINDMLVSTVDLDLDQDGVHDLQFELSTGTQEDLQLLMVRSLQATMIPEGVMEHHGLLKQPNEPAEAPLANWLNNEWLLLYFTNPRDSWTAAPITEQSGYLPVQVAAQKGWLEIQLLMNADQSKVWGLNVKQLALKSL